MSGIIGGSAGSEESGPSADFLGLTLRTSLPRVPVRAAIVTLLRLIPSPPPDRVDNMLNRRIQGPDGLSFSSSLE